MTIYQVNQRDTFLKEFNEGYICCPTGNRGGWSLLRAMNSGDILIHYNSERGKALGVSVVASSCFSYRGKHLSELFMSQNQIDDYRQKYSKFYAVPTVKIMELDQEWNAEGKQVYVFKLDRERLSSLDFSVIDVSDVQINNSINNLYNLIFDNIRGDIKQMIRMPRA